jgi:hypothetical protein
MSRPSSSSASRAATSSASAFRLFNRAAGSMGSAAVGIAAIDPPQAQVLAERYKSLLDETVIRPVATLPVAASPTLDEVFEAFSVILEIAHPLRRRPNSADQTPRATYLATLASSLPSALREVSGGLLSS